MKGISLPIEMIVVIAVAVLVLVVIAAVFLGQSSRNYTYIDHQRALTQGCSLLSFNYECDASRLSEIKVPDYDHSCNGAEKGTLEAACCALKYEYSDLQNSNHCAYVACKCPQPLS
ncbi:MAG: hypothetical protein HYW25_04990 [Candidatus Aenigmarchaeota archaeon]|nr:hypothetical protein [Candidatus Aenigmarchaeota archaeon]